MTVYPLATRPSPLYTISMIGVFDSGVGGLTVVRELFRQLPQADVLYFGDTARAPYGNKSSQTIVKYALEDTAFLLSQGATAIVIGCNTASAEATAAIHEAHPTVPLFEVISPAVQAAVSVSQNKRIGVIGTRGTIGSGVYQRQLSTVDPRLTVFAAACPLLVSLVEEDWIDQPETRLIVGRYLQPLVDSHIDTLILGCTHYPLLTGVISAKLGKHITLVDPAAAVVRALVTSLLPAAHRGQGNRQFFASDVTAPMQTVARRWLGSEIDWQTASVEVI